MRRVPLSAALRCLLVIPTALVSTSCTPGVALKDYPDTWAKFERVSASNNCSEVQGTYLDEGTADDGTAVSLHYLLRTRRDSGVSPGIVKLRFDKSGVLEVEARAGDQRDKPCLTQTKAGWKCTNAGIRFHQKPPPRDDVSLGYSLYLLPGTDGALIIRRVDTKIVGYGAFWFVRKRAWWRFPSAE